MLFLLFRIGDEGYALDAGRIVEILPLMALQRIRGATSEVAGSFRYRGAFVPVVDLDQLELGRPAPRRMGTRLLVVEISTGARDGGRARIGLVAAGATETLRCEPDAFTPFATGPRGLVQRLDLDTLLPARLRDLLFARATAAAA